MTNGNNDNPIINTPHVREQLSDYMDGLLAGDALEAVRAHLEVCPDCRADYIELRATQKIVRNMPTLAVPRAFTLTPEMAGQVRKPSFWERFLTPANSPRLATGSVLAFMLLFFFVASGFLRSSSVSTFSKIASGLSDGGSESYSSQPVPPASKQSPTDLAMAAPTATTGVSSFSMTPSTGGGASGATAPQATEPTTMADIQPTQAPPASGDTQTTSGESSAPGVVSPPAPNLVATPNTNVTNSGTSSPTTTTLDNPTPPADRLIAPGQPSGSAGTNATAGNDNDNATGSTLWVIVQIGLLTLALALGVAAFIARRGV